jgi:hypothetical protein
MSTLFSNAFDPSLSMKQPGAMFVWTTPNELRESFLIGVSMICSGGRGVSIYPATSGGAGVLPFGSGLLTRSPRPSSRRERHDSAFVRLKLELLSLSGYR